MTSRQQALEKAGRLTSGDTPVHVRRQDLANQLETCRHTLTTMLANWPAEYEIPPDHQLIELIEVMGIVAEGLITP